jgi:hypothetical protein
MSEDGEDIVKQKKWPQIRKEKRISNIPNNKELVLEDDS